MGSLSNPLPLPTSRPQLTTHLLPTLLTSIASIAATLRTAQTISTTKTSNTFGDAQLNVDLLAEQHIRAALASVPCVATASSEEDPEEVAVYPTPSRSSPADPAPETYTVAFDPLDGSSIIAPNWTVGTILSVWDGPTAINRDPKTHQVAAVLGVYGPRTTAIIAVRWPGQAGVCIELGLGETGWTVVREDVTLRSGGGTRYFAPANLRAASEDARYMGVIEHFVKERYTLRYSGGLVPDVVHALVKGHGVYASPVTKESKAKLRRLYELCPLALVVECAGGKAVDPVDGGDVLGRVIGGCDERGGLVCGNGEEVEFVVGRLLG
ncbi:hypothetical protein OQA88_9490 [Cercophora sp. LCS_1]